MGAGGAAVRRTGAGGLGGRVRRVRPLGALLAAALASAIAVAGCGEEEARPTGEAPEVFLEGAGQVMVGVTNFITRSGIRTAVLQADTAYTFDEAGRLELRSVTLTFFGNAGDTTGVLTSREAVYELAGGDVVVRGDVEVRLRTGETLEAPLLFYVSDSNEIRADSGYVMTKSDGTVDRGTYLVRDLESDETEYGPGRTTTPEIAVPQ